MSFRNLSTALEYAQTAVWHRDVGSLRWYIVGTSREQSLAARALKKTIDEKLLKAVAENELLAYASEFVDFDLTPEAKNRGHSVWRKLESTRFFEAPGPTSSIYLPFFVNIGDRNNLGQELFDGYMPGVICLGKRQYWSTTNPSKRETFNTIWLYRD